jgi:hypothetical protein
MIQGSQQLASEQIRNRAREILTEKHHRYEGQLLSLRLSRQSKDTTNKLWAWIVNRKYDLIASLLFEKRELVDGLLNGNHTTSQLKSGEVLAPGPDVIAQQQADAKRAIEALEQLLEDIRLLESDIREQEGEE